MFLSIIFVYSCFNWIWLIFIGYSVGRIKLYIANGNCQFFGFLSFLTHRWINDYIDDLKYKMCICWFVAGILIEYYFQKESEEEHLLNGVQMPKKQLRTEQLILILSSFERAHICTIWKRAKHFVFHHIPRNDPLWFDMTLNVFVFTVSLVEKLLILVYYRDVVCTVHLYV